jgi:site-specific recombinase XerD
MCQEDKPMNPLLSEVETWLSEQPFSENTSDRYRRALLQVSEDLDLSILTPAKLKSFFVGKGWGNSTQWVAMNAIKGFAKWRYGHKHPILSLKLPRRKSPPQRALRLHQITQLMQSFDTHSVKGRRDLAMATLFIDTGLRVSEVVSARMRYLKLEELKLHVIVKGGDWAEAVFSPLVANYLSAWLADRERIARPGVETIFVGVGGLKPGESMTRHGVQCIVKTWGKNAGLGKLSPHDFRRTMATESTRLGAPQKVVMAAGRWNDDRTMLRYVATIEAEDIREYSPIMAAMR